MELRRYLAIVRRKLPLIFVSVLLGLLAAYLATPRTVRYTATATLYVGSQVVNNDPRAGELSNDRTAAINQFVQTYAEIIKTEALAADAVNSSGLPVSPQALVGSTETKPVLGTTLLKVSVTDPDPGRAQRLANALATSFVRRQSELESSGSRSSATTSTTDPGNGIDGQPSAPDVVVGGIPVTVTDPAKLPVVPQPTGLSRNLILGALFGMVISVGIIALLEYLDVTIKTASEAERRLELPVLGVLPLHGGRDAIAAARVNGAASPERSLA